MNREAFNPDAYPVIDLKATGQNTVDELLVLSSDEPEIEDHRNGAAA